MILFFTEVISMKKIKYSLLSLLLITLSTAACQPNLKLFGLEDPTDAEDGGSGGGKKGDGTADGGDDGEEYDDDVIPEKREYTYKGENALDHLGKETGTIEFQTGGSSAEKILWDTLVNDFMSKNPGITVKQVNIDKDETLQANLTAGTAPDVIQVQSAVFGSWAQKGWFQSIQPFVNGEVNGIDTLKVDDYYPQAIQMFRLNTETGVRGNGDMFGLPKDFGVIGVFVNKEMVMNRYNRGAFSHYPEGASDYSKLMAQEQLTYDEYFRIAHHLTLDCHVDSNGKHDHSRGYWETNVYGANRIHWESFLWGYNADILTDDYKLNVDNDYVKYVFEQCRNQVTPGTSTFYSLYSDSGATDSGTAFTGRRIIMYMGGRWNVSTFDASFKIGSSQGYFCIPVPVWHVKYAPTGACSTVCYAISKNCKNTKMAYKLIRYLASREGYRIMNQMNYAVPGIKDLKNEAKFKNPQANNSPYDGGFGNVTCNLNEKSAATFFEMADNARISNACRFTTANWITTFETGLNSFLQDTSKTKYKTSADFLNSVRKSVNSAIKKSDPQLFW